MVCILTSLTHYFSIKFHIQISESVLEILEMCSVSTNGERASPAQKEGSQLIGCHFSYSLL